MRPNKIWMLDQSTRALLLWGPDYALPLPWSGPLTGLTSVPPVASDYLNRPGWDGVHVADAILEGFGVNDPPAQGRLVYHLRSGDGAPTAAQTLFVPPMPVENPTVVGLGQGKALVAYSRVLGEREVGTFRVRYQLLDSTEVTAGTADAAAGEGDGGAPDAAPAGAHDGGGAEVAADAAAVDTGGGVGDVPAGAAVDGMAASVADGASVDSPTSSGADGAPAGAADAAAVTDAADQKLATPGCACRLDRRSGGGHLPVIALLVLAAATRRRCAGRRAPAR